MKTKLIYLIICITSILFYSCVSQLNDDIIEIDDSKSGIEITNSDIIGIWINTYNHDDTIQIFDSIIKRWNPISNSFFHYYKYNILIDTIFLKYTGLYKVMTPPYYRKIYLNNRKDSLAIRYFHTVYPSYRGDKFIRILK